MLSPTAPRSTQEHVQRLKEFAARRKDTAGAPAAERPKERKMKKTLQTISKAEVQAITAFFRDHPTADQKRYADKQNIDLRTLRSILRDDVHNQPAPVAEPEPEEAPADVAETSAPFDGEHRVTPALDDDLLIAIDQLPADHPDQERWQDLHADVARTLEQSPAMSPDHPEYDTWRRGTEPGQAPDLPAFWEAPFVALSKLVQSGNVSGRIAIQLDLTFEFGENNG